MAKYIQYFCTNDFSFGGVTGLPSAVSGGGVRSWGLRGRRSGRVMISRLL